MAITCPTLKNVTAEDLCGENLAGLGTKVYFGRKSDLAAAGITVKTGAGNENIYQFSENPFASNKGLYYLECKDEGQQIQGGSLGQNKGFKLQFDITIEMVNQMTSLLGRALNNYRDLFFIVEDGDEIQIMYDAQRKVKFDADGIKTDTGKAASDERTTTLSAVLQPVNFPNLLLELPEGKSLEDFVISAE